MIDKHQHNMKKLIAKIKASAYSPAPPRRNIEYIKDLHGIKAYVVDMGDRWKDLAEATVLSPLILEHGWGNGYVQVPPGHPWFKKWYDDIKCSAHGGLTYAQLEGEMWTVGFDTMHYKDTIKAWPKKRVVLATLRLMKQALKSQNNKKYYDKRKLFLTKRKGGNINK